MRRVLIAGIAAAGIVSGAAACGAQDSARPRMQPSADGGVTGTWTIASCAVDVSYISVTNAVDYYLPDTDANFRRYFVPNQASGAASVVVVVTLVNNAGGPAPLPTGLIVSLTDRSGRAVGNPQTFNNTNGTGYGPAVANGRGSGEVFSASTLFSPGQTVAETPDIGAALPQQPGLSCRVRPDRSVSATWH
jgi:hypothetical protein